MQRQIQTEDLIDVRPARTLPIAGRLESRRGLDLGDSVRKAREKRAPAWWMLSGNIRPSS